MTEVKNEDIEKIITDGDTRFAIFAVSLLATGLLLISGSIACYYLDWIDGGKALLFGFIGAFVSCFDFSGVEGAVESIDRNKELNLLKENINIDDGSNYVLEASLGEYIDQPFSGKQLEKFKAIEEKRRPALIKGRNFSLGIMIMTALIYVCFWLYMNSYEYLDNDPFAIVTKVLMHPFIYGTMGFFTILMSYFATQSGFSKKAFNKNQTILRILEHTTIKHASWFKEEKLDKELIQGNKDACRLYENISKQDRNPYSFEIDIFRAFCKF
jgi:hypothetical protein